MARLILPWIAIIGLAAAWEVFARSGAVTPFMLPRLSTVLERMWADGASGELWQNLGWTMYRSLPGFAIATVLGLAPGFAVAFNRAARCLLNPMLSVALP